MFYGRSTVLGISLVLHLLLAVGLSYFSNPQVLTNSSRGTAVKISLFSFDKKYSSSTDAATQQEKKHSAKSANGHAVLRIPRHAEKFSTTATLKTITYPDAESNAELVDQSPILERDSIKVPRFTLDALSRGFRGMLVLDLFLDEAGEVIDLKLRNPTGLRIDGEAIASARNAKYRPALDAFGRPTASRAELRFDFMGH